MEPCRDRMPGIKFSLPAKPLVAARTIAQRRPPALTDIISALDHPKIFAPHFCGASWQPWRVFLKALFAIPMDDDELKFYRRQTERTAEPMEPFREVALVVGRRGGKSRILALVAVYLGVFWPNCCGPAWLRWVCRNRRMPLARGGLRSSSAPAISIRASPSRPGGCSTPPRG
jgi:hypothetical protein